MEVRFWGTRGSIATPGPETVRFGGNTSCVEVVSKAGRRFILDCGTGARLLGLHLMAKGQPRIRATILLSHTHWDHIQGFPFFQPAFHSGDEFLICAPLGVSGSLSQVLAGQMETTYFPVELSELPAKISYRHLAEGVFDFHGVRVSTHLLHHPGATLGYRIESDGVAVAYLSDHEPYSDLLWRPGAEPGKVESILHEGDRRHAEFMRNADLVIHDAQYTPEEMPKKKHWGHSSYEYAVELAGAAGVRQLALTHHEPAHNDDLLKEIEQRARALAVSRNYALDVFCAFEGCELTVKPIKQRAKAPVSVK
jgi:phosphoribosyl 1,2-cyclic phosphodiesterase